MATTLLIDNLSETQLSAPNYYSPFCSDNGATGALPQNVFVDSGNNSANVIGGKREIIPAFCSPSISGGKLTFTKNEWSSLILNYNLVSDRNITSVTFQFGTLAATMKCCCAFAPFSSRASASVAFFDATSGGTATINAGSFSGAANLASVRWFQFRLLPDASTSGTFELLNIEATI